jgi:hypothetical protein
MAVLRTNALAAYAHAPSEVEDANDIEVKRITETELNEIPLGTYAHGLGKIFQNQPMPPSHQKVAVSNAKEGRGKRGPITVALAIKWTCPLLRP